MDAELTQIFFEEAQEISSNIAKLLAKLANNINDSNSLTDILRNLHTLKGSAKMVGQDQIGHIAHLLEQKITDLLQRNLENQSKLFTKLQTWFDTLHSFIEAQSIDEHKYEQLISQIDLKPQANSQAFKNNNPSQSNISDNYKSDSLDNEKLRISASTIEKLANLAAEVNLARVNMSQQIEYLTQSSESLSSKIKYLIDHLRTLELKIDANSLARTNQKPNLKFDPLELDNYSFLQTDLRDILANTEDLSQLINLNHHGVQRLDTSLTKLDINAKNLESGLVQTKLIPVSQFVPRFERIVRQVAKELEKQVNFVCPAIDGSVDRTLLQNLVPVIEHLIRNAIDHGIETNQARVNANKSQYGNLSLTINCTSKAINILLKDDGKGIDLNQVKKIALEKKLINPDTQVSSDDILRLVLTPGFSTKDEVTDISGRGVGLDIVNQSIKKLGGSLNITTKQDKGTSFIIEIPVTSSLRNVLVFELNSQFYGVLLSQIKGVIRLPFEEVFKKANQENQFIEYAKQKYPLYDCGMLIHARKTLQQLATSSTMPVILLEINNTNFALIVDNVTKSHELAIKPLGVHLSSLTNFFGSATLGTGQIVLIIEPKSILKNTKLIKSSQADHFDFATETINTPSKQILIVDDSTTMRKISSKIIERTRFSSKTAKDGIEALELLAKDNFACVLLDLEMPRLDGFEVLKQMQASPKLKDIPVIVITSRGGEKHKNLALKLGANSYLSKPFVAEDLLNELNKLIAL